MELKCADCQHFSCRGDEYIANCAVCRNRSRFVDRMQDSAPSEPVDYRSGNSGYGVGSIRTFQDDYRREEPPVRNTWEREEKNMQNSDSALRDKFAMIALQNSNLDIVHTSPRQIAKICYDIADAMLANR